MNWSTRRKLAYGVSLAVLIFVVLLYTFRDTIFPAPTCFDGKQNAYESGIDCGGLCSLRCTQDITPLSVKWSRALLTSPNMYDIVAMVSNNNIDNTTRSLGYSFAIYNNNGVVIGTITGTTTAPVNGDFPIIRQNIQLTEMPKEVITQLSDGPHYLVAEKPTSPTVRETNIRYEAGSIPRVYASIINTKRVTISNLPVRVVVYDVDNNAFAVGETVIPFLDKEAVRDASFTWNMPFTKVPAKISIYPIFDPFAGTK